MTPWPPKTLHGEARPLVGLGTPRDLSQWQTCSLASVLLGTRRPCLHPRPSHLLACLPCVHLACGKRVLALVLGEQEWDMSDHRRPGWWPDPAIGREGGIDVSCGDGRRGVETLSPSKVMFTGPPRWTRPFAGTVSPFQWLCSGSVHT